MHVLHLTRGIPGRRAQGGDFNLHGLRVARTALPAEPLVCLGLTAAMATVYISENPPPSTNHCSQDQTSKVSHRAPVTPLSSKTTLGVSNKSFDF